MAATVDGVGARSGTERAIQAFDQILGFLHSPPERETSVQSAARALQSALAQLSKEQAPGFVSAVADRVTQLATFTPPLATAANMTAGAATVQAAFLQTLAGSFAARVLMGWLLGDGGPEVCPAGLLAPQAAFRMVSSCAVALGPGIQATAAAVHAWEERNSGLPAQQGNVPHGLVLAAATHLSVAASAAELAVADSDWQLARALRAGMCRPQRLNAFLTAALPALKVVAGTQGPLMPQLWEHLDSILRSLRSSSWGEPQLRALNPDTLRTLALLAAREHTALYDRLPQLGSQRLSVGPWVEQWRPVARAASWAWASQQGGSSSSHSVLRQLLPITVAALRAVAGRGGGHAVACTAVICLARLVRLRLITRLHGEQEVPPAAELVDCMEAVAVVASSFVALAPSTPVELTTEVYGLLMALEEELRPGDVSPCLRDAPGAAAAVAAANEAVTRLAAALVQQWQAAAADRQRQQLAAKALGAAMVLAVIDYNVHKQAPGEALRPDRQHAAVHTGISVTKLALSIGQLSAEQLQVLAGLVPLGLSVLSSVLVSSVGAVGGFPEQDGSGEALGAAAGAPDNGAVASRDATGVLWAGVLAGRALAALPLAEGAEFLAIGRAEVLSQLLPWVSQQHCSFIDMMLNACDMMADAAAAVLGATPCSTQGVGKMAKFLTEFECVFAECPRVGVTLVRRGFCARLVSWVQQAACGPQEGASQEELGLLGAARDVMLFTGATVFSSLTERQTVTSAEKELMSKVGSLRSIPPRKLRPRRFWQQRILAELLPQLEVWAEAAAERWQADELGMTAQTRMAHEYAFLGRPCVNLRCTTVRGASEGRLRGRQCGGCGTVRYCCRSCQEQDWPRHRHTCAFIAAKT